MKKALQASINKEAINGVNLWEQATVVLSRERLYTCKAEVLRLNNNCIALSSYGTFVALFDTETGIFYDVLRYVYGYTATSAQHIAKFRNLLSPLITAEYRYYSI